MDKTVENVTTEITEPVSGRVIARHESGMMNAGPQPPYFVPPNGTMFPPEQFGFGGAGYGDHFNGFAPQ